MAEPLIRPLADLFAGSTAPVAVALLSLPDCQGRRQALQDRGLPSAWIERYWPGADLRGQPSARCAPYLDAAAIHRRYRRPWRSSEVGCALSHRLALQTFLASSARWLLVLEDDVIPTASDPEAALESVLQPLLALSPRPLLCHLGPRPEHLERRDLRPLLWRPPGLALAQPLVGLQQHQNRARPLWRAHAYLISRPATARCLALEPAGLQLLADDWQARREAGALGRLLVADPPLFLQDDATPSTQQEPIPLAPAARRDLRRALTHRVWRLQDRLLRRFPARLA